MSTDTATVIRSVAEKVATNAAGGVRTARGGLSRARDRVAFVGPWLEWLGARASTAARAVWRVIGPVLVVVSPLGWLVLLMGLASLVVSWTLSWLEFAFLGATLLAAVALATAFVAGRSTYGAQVELEPRRVVVGDRAMGRLVVENIGRRNLLPSRIEMPVGRAIAEFGVPALAPGETTDELFAVPTVRRAVITAGPVVAVRGDQLGLLRRTVKCAEAIELFVHPQTARLAPAAAGLLHDLEGRVTRRLSNSDMAFHALRDYVAGDDRRYVDWKASARTGRLMVRQFEETRRSHLTLVLSADERYYGSGEEFELAVSVTASIAGQVIRSGNDLSVVSDRHQLSTRSVARLLDDTCRLELLPRSFATPRDFARETTKRLPPPTVLIFVGGSRLPLTDLRSMHALFAGDVRSFAFLAKDDAPPSISSIPGLAVATIGKLDELRGLIRNLSAT